MLRLSANLALPLGAVFLTAVRKAETRFWRAVRRSDQSECWPWTKSCDSYGYGHLKILGKLVKAHRVAFAIHNGWLPSLVMHKCDNPPCCNPLHLIPGSKLLNHRDMVAKGRRVLAIGDANGSRKHPESLPRGGTHYSRQRPHLLLRGERHGMAVLSAQAVLEIRKRFASGGVTKAELSREFGIGQSHVGRIIRGESWSHV